MNSRASRKAPPAAASILVFCILGCAHAQRIPSSHDFVSLSDSERVWLAARIFQNETGGDPRHLTYWGAGEDFPSLGIGHFIWFPAGVDAPFDESFPAMFHWVRKQQSTCHSVPEWLEALEPFDAPWSSRSDFDRALSGHRLAELRRWLEATALDQAEFIVASFLRRWQELDLHYAEKERLANLLQGLLQSPQGTFAVIDYYNFKGLGSNPDERYRGEGWGLLQVLGDLADRNVAPGAAELPRCFAKAAADRLQLRVKNSPPERSEERWLEGWIARVEGYYKVIPDFGASAHSDIRSLPYLRDVGETTASVSWLSEDATPGRLQLTSSGNKSSSVLASVRSSPKPACALSYHLGELENVVGSASLPYLHIATAKNLAPGATYRYTVHQGDDDAEGTLRTVDPNSDAVRFIVYGDSETEPESAGKHAAWAETGADASRYIVDQAEGYQANLEAIAAQRPDFVAIAGDLVESGGEQRDWDEFWRMNATLAASVPMVAAAGNHEYYGGPGILGGYSSEAVRRSIAKFHTYFGRDTYFTRRHGPVALIVLDVNNGKPERSPVDTNWYLSTDADNRMVPDWQAGSEQWRWMEAELHKAQRDAAFTFVMFHHAPYSTGIHGRMPGLGETHNFSSGLPLRQLSPVFLRYGVDAVFSGHDEMYEHSAIEGIEVRPDGTPVEHTLHFYTVGIGGDGLRGTDSLAENPYRVFSAAASADGAHYGHLAVNASRIDGNIWHARIEPVYLLPVPGNGSRPLNFARRIYDDVVVLESTVGN